MGMKTRLFDNRVVTRGESMFIAIVAAIVYAAKTSGVARNFKGGGQ